MNLDEYRDRLATSHQPLTDSMMAMIATDGRTQTVFTDLLREGDQYAAGSKESNEKRRRLILDHGEPLRVLMARFDGGNSR